MKRTLSLAASAIAAALVLTACTAPAPEQTEAAPDRGSVTLTIYSNSVSNGRGERLVELAEAAGFSIEYVDLGAVEVQNRIIAEKNNPIADLYFGPNSVVSTRMSEEGTLEPYTPAWADLVPQEAAGPNGDFWPIVREPIMLVYNSDAYTEATAPQDWPDLWERPEFQGKYETNGNIRSGTSSTVIAGILSRYQDDNGDLGVSDEGWKAIENYYKYGSPEIEGTDLYARIASGELVAGQMFLAGKFAREAQYGVKTEAVRPQIGVPFVYQQVALVKGAPNAEVAKQFIDWFGSADVQATWSQEFFTVPTNSDALVFASQEAVDYTNSFTEQKIDWSFVAKNLDSWLEKIELDYVTQ